MKIRPKIPSPLVERREVWDSIYFTMNEPPPPVEPDNFTAVVAAAADDDDEEEEEIDMETLARVNGDLPRTAASIQHFEAAQSLFTLTGLQLMPHICGTKKGSFFQRGISPTKIGPKDFY
jgi:hypothetical protein